MKKPPRRWREREGGLTLSNVILPLPLAWSKLLDRTSSYGDSRPAATPATVFFPNGSVITAGGTP